MQPKHTTDDKPLLIRLKRGSKVAFNTLFFAYEPILYTYTLKLTHHPEDAREVVQEVFLKVWEKRNQIDPESNFGGYLYTIAKHRVYNRARRRVYDLAYQKYLASRPHPMANSTEDRVRFNELSEIVRIASQQLPPVRKEVFTLSRMEGLSNQEIAERLNTSTSNVKNHINKALRYLKKQLQTHQITPLLFVTSAIWFL